MRSTDSYLLPVLMLGQRDVSPHVSTIHRLFSVQPNPSSKQFHALKKKTHRVQVADQLCSAPAPTSLKCSGSATPQHGCSTSWVCACTSSSRIGLGITRATLHFKELFGTHAGGMHYKQAVELTYWRTKRPVKKHNEGS